MAIGPQSHGTATLTSASLARLLVAAPLRTQDAQHFRLGARDRALARLVRIRLFAAPLLSAAAITFMVFEPTLWRRVVLGCVVALMWTVSIFEWLQHRRHGVVALGIPANYAAMALGQLAIAIATGGLFSPLIPPAIVIGVVGAILLDPKIQVRIVALVVVPVWFAMATAHAADGFSLIPTMFGDAGSLESGPAPWIACALYSFMSLIAIGMGTMIRRTFEHLFTDAVGERDRTLELHADHSRALSALSAEIAHELKNPLASVKGLAALIAKDVEGKSAERVGVLRREVDRMQSILEDLLTFSRPLVPLSMERIDLRALVLEVLRLHEGMAAERGIGLRVERGEPLEITCDPRKVRQVLINVLQNALEASSRGTEVTVALTHDARHVSVNIQDEGEGIEPELLARAFEPGVTSKKQGSGIGLAVARALARQHDGDLHLENRSDGRGALARLDLPRNPS